MGRLVRRYIRVYDLTIVNESYVNKVQSISETVNLRPLRSGITINDGVTLTGYTYGAHIELNILGTGIVTSFFDGVRIEMGSEVGTETVWNVHGIFISNYNLGTQAANAYYFLRMQENGSYIVHSMLYLRGGTGGVEFFATLHGDTNAWNALGAPTTQSGWIRLYAGGLERWIRLYSVAP